MQYTQMFGRYNGSVVDRNGTTHVIENVYGTAERGVITNIFSP